MTRAASGGLARIGAVARRDAFIQVSYQFGLLSFFTGTFVSAFLAFYVSDLVGETDLLRRYQGSYFDFVVLGIALTSYAGFGVSAFTGQITAEQSAGTFEVLLSGPSRLVTLLIGGLVVPFALTTIEVLLLIGVGVGALGAGLSLYGLVVAVPIVLLTIANFCALGIASAALVLLAKRGDPISGPIYQLTLLLSGAVFPVELLPGWLEALAKLTPAYYGVRGLREALLADAGFSGVGDEIVLLAAFAAVLLPLAVWLFGRSVAKAKELGVLGSY